MQTPPQGDSGNRDACLPAAQRQHNLPSTATATLWTLQIKQSGRRQVISVIGTEPNSSSTSSTKQQACDCCRRLRLSGQLAGLNCRQLPKLGWHTERATHHLPGSSAAATEVAVPHLARLQSATLCSIHTGSPIEGRFKAVVMWHQQHPLKRCCSHCERPCQHCKLCSELHSSKKQKHMAACAAHKVCDSNTHVRPGIVINSLTRARRDITRGLGACRRSQRPDTQITPSLASYSWMHQGAQGTWDSLSWSVGTTATPKGTQLWHKTSTHTHTHALAKHATLQPVGGHTVAISTVCDKLTL